MKYLINLYTEELREKPIPYGFPWLVGALLAVGFLVSVQGWFTHQRLVELKNQKMGLEQRKSGLDESIKAMEAQLATTEQREAVENERQALLQDIQGRERLLDELGQVIEHPRQGFSPALRGLAEATGQGVWLESIQLRRPSTGTQEVRLIGLTQQGDRLPDYIDALGRAEAFRGLHFNSMQALRLVREPPQAQAAPQPGTIAAPTLVKFLLSTRADDALQGGDRR